MYSCPFPSTITNDVESSTKRIPRARARTAVVVSASPLSRGKTRDTGEPCSFPAFNITHTRPLTETIAKAEGRLRFKLNMFGRRWGRLAFRMRVLLSGQEGHITLSRVERQGTVLSL